MMACKSLGKHFSHRDDSNQCIIYRKCKPKTFSSFVGKVIRDAPVTVATRHLPMDTNNPIDVLKSNGLLNFSQGAALHGDCSSDVTLNFYSEELRHSKPMKIFASNHRFRHGRLVYSSTQEWLPDQPTEMEKSLEWQTKRALSDVDLRTSFQTVPKKSVRKNLTDLLRDINRQRILRLHESDARRSRFCSRSLSPVNICDNKHKNSKRYLHTLRHVERSLSPKGFRCHTTKRATFRHPDQIACAKSSSETSISSRESWFYPSPKGEIEETSKFNEKYRYTRITSPRPKFEQDLFVIPKHTCRKAPHGGSSRSHWNIVRNYITSSCHKYENPNTSSCFRKEEFKHRDHVIRNSEVPHKYTDQMAEMSMQHDAKIRRGEAYDASFKSGRTPQGKRPPKGILSNKNSPPSHKIRFHDDSSNGKEKMQRERGEAEYSILHKHAKMSNDRKSVTLKQCKEEESSGHDDRIRRGLVASTESDSDSDSIPRTEPFSPSKDLRDETDKAKTQLSSDTSDTSICSIRPSDQVKGISSSPRSSNRPTNEHVRGDSKKYYKKYKKQSYEHSEPARKRGNERKKPVKVERYQKREEFKDGKKRRQINPNAIVHMESDGKRLSQHYSDDKVTLDSEKAFADEEKIHSQKIAFHNYSPRRCDTAIKVYREESLDDYLKRVLREDHKKNLRLIESAINREALTEYRRKYTNNTCTNSSKKDFFRSTETRHCDQYEMTDAERCDSEGCQACIIERLLGEN